MNKQELYHLWKVLADSGKSPDRETRLVSFGLNHYAGQMNVSCAVTSPLQEEPAEADRTILPSFKNLDAAIMAWLQYEACRMESAGGVEAWAEKLMRFCEVRKTVLKSKALEKWGLLSNASLNMRKLTVFFLDYYLVTGDYRFLNTAFKLGDMKWILDKKSVGEVVRGSGKMNLSMLLQGKIYLVLHCESNQITIGMDSQDPCLDS